MTRVATAERRCYVTPEWDPATPGGIGLAVRERAMSEAAGAIVLLDLPASAVRSVQDESPPGIDFYSVEGLAPGGLPSSVFRSEAFARSYKIWRAIAALLDFESVSTIEFVDYEGPAFVPVKAARLGIDRGVPPIDIRLHGTAERTAVGDERAMLGIEAKQRASMERYALAHADRILSPSKAVADEYREQYDLPESIVIDPPGVPSPDAKWCPPHADLPLVLGYLGKLQPIKGPATLIRAAVRALRARGGDGLKVHLVGGDTRGWYDASHRAELERLIPEALRRHFTFHGAAPRAQAHGLLADCHAAVLPSRSETFGLAARELAAMGLPLALTDIPAFEDGFNASQVEIAHFPVDDDVALSGILENWLVQLDGHRWPPRASIAERGAEVSSHAAPGEHFGKESTPRRSLEMATIEPLVSIVIPFFEMHRYLEACLASVESDPYPNKEIIVVDDGSESAEARAMVDALRARFEPLPDRHVIQKSNGGLGSARNTGIVAARGEYVLPLDADDLIVSGYLGATVEALTRAPELTFVVGISSLFPDASDPEKEVDWIVPYDPDRGMLFSENGAGTAAAVFRRESLIRYPYREDLPAYEDWDLHLRLAKAGRKGEMLPVVFHRYRQRRDGLSRLAHRHHDQIVAKVIEPHLAGLDPDLASAFQIQLAELSRSRGLGRERRFLIDRLGDEVESFYRRRLKTWLRDRLGTERRDRLAARVRAMLRGR